MIDDVKGAKSGEWYSKLKRITRYDQGRSDVIQVEEINHLNDQDQAEMIASHQATISNSYKGIERSDIDIPPFGPEDIPQLTESKVKEYIARLKSKKATPPGDIPVKIIKEFSQFLCIPLTDIINSSITQGVWAACYKKEVITPVPKEYPPSQMNMLRPISSLLSFNKIQEMAVCDMIAIDMAERQDPTQYGDQKRTWIQHYLVRMINRILSDADADAHLSTGRKPTRGNLTF